MGLSDLEKIGLSLIVIVIGVPSLPFTGGVSGIVLLGILLAIWGVDTDAV